MKPKHYQITLIVISSILAVFAILIGDKLWESIGFNDQNVKSNLTIASTILVLFLGFLFTFQSMIMEIQRENKNFQNDLIIDLKNSIPEIETLKKYSAQEAFFHISEKVIHSKLALNTRIFAPELGDDHEIYVGGTDIWHKAVIQAICNGTLFRDVVSNLGVKIAKQTKSNIVLSKRKIKGEYKAMQIDTDVPILNFILFHFKDGTKEVWYGWRISVGKGLEQPVFKSNDIRVISMFENWHGDMFKKGRNI